MDENISRIISQLVKARGEESQRSLAKRIGVNNTTLNRYENKVKVPSLSFLTLWAYALGFDLALTITEK